MVLPKCVYQCMRLFILLLLLAPLTAFSQTTFDSVGEEIDTLSISVIMPHSEIEFLDIYRFDIVCGQHKTIIEYQVEPLGQFDLINRPRELWFFWDLIAVRD